MSSVCRLPSAVCRLPSAVCSLPSAVYHIPSAVWRLLSAVCRLRAYRPHIIGYDWNGKIHEQSKCICTKLYERSETNFSSKLNEQSELISISTNSGRHHPRCLWTFGCPKIILRRKYLNGENKLASNFHVIWFISLLLLSLLRYPLIYTSPLVGRVLRHILSLTIENYLMNG